MAMNIAYTSVKMDDPKQKKVRRPGALNGDSPFEVIDGGKKAGVDGPRQPERVRTEVAYEGVTMILDGDVEVWRVEDPEAWADVEFSRLPAMVALVTLGLARDNGALTPGQARDLVRGALERAGELSSKRARALGFIPSRSDQFAQPDLPTTATLEFWWARWWPGLA